MPLLLVLPHELGHAVVARAFGAPFTTLLLILVYAAAGTATTGFLRWAFWFLALGGVWEFAVTALPIKYGRFFGPYAGRVSDGYRIREALSQP